MTARKQAVAAIATHKVASTENYLEHAGEDIYGSYIFGDDAQKEYLPKQVYKKLRQTIDGAKPFDPSIADAVAQGMKTWALEHGATTLHPLVRPADGHHGREARLLLEP